VIELVYPEAWAAHLPRGVDPAAIDLTAQRSLPAAWSQRWSEDPAAPAIRWQDTWLTNSDLAAASARVAGRMDGAGLARGQRILMSAASSSDLVVAHVAALRLGLVVVPVNTAYRKREMTQIVRDAEPSAALVDERNRAEWVRDAAPNAVITTPAVELPDCEPPELDSCDPADPALVGYTSGTTGAPKGAVLSHSNLLASAESVAIAWRWTRSDRLLLCLPLFHAHGLCVGLHGSFLVGGSALLLPAFELDYVLDSITRHECTMFFGVPTMYHRLANSSRAQELARLRLCVSGSAPLAATLHSRLAEVAGQPILERYGMTETLMNVSNPYDGERRPGSVGLPLPGCEMRLATDGEIQLRGPNVFAGYWRNECATGEAFENGWFRSGDLGQLDGDGYLRILGRSKELIISGGFNVYPREVEDVLTEHPAVAEVAVVGTPSEEWGEVVTAFIVPRGSPVNEHELVSWVSGRLASFKRPRLWHFVEALPRNAMGKVVRSELVR
jgi:malonyl-CoA/methylmalonyl-CoA synthetase